MSVAISPTQSNYSSKDAPPAFDVTVPTSQRFDVQVTTVPSLFSGTLNGRRFKDNFFSSWDGAQGIPPLRDEAADSPFSYSLPGPAWKNLQQSFRRSPFLYYRVRTVNRNGDTIETSLPDSSYEDARFVLIKLPGIPAPPIPVFPPSPYPDPFKSNNKLQHALERAILTATTRRRQTDGSFPIPFTIAEVTTGTGSFASAHFRGDEVDFIASEVKVAALYAAYELRSTVRRFAHAIGATSETRLFERLESQIDPWLLTQVPAIRDGKQVNDTTVVPRLENKHRVPRYPAVFTATTVSGKLDIDFTTAYKTALRQMIIPSSNSDAGTCIHGIGYSYLNGALAAAGFLTLSAAERLSETTGVWLAADFMGVYPKVRGVDSVNDGPSGQAGTTKQMARILALIKTGALVDGSSSAEMATILHSAAAGPDQPWASRAPSPPLISPLKFVYNKLGLARLKPDSSGPEVRSECSLISGPVDPGRQYVVAWQNLQGFRPYGFADISQIIVDTITDFETP